MSASRPLGVGEGCDHRADADSGLLQSRARTRTSTHVYFNTSTHTCTMLGHLLQYMY